MNYELALELKEAGFPQVQPHSIGYDFKDCTNPMLSELIEACGENFYDLARMTDAEGVAWAARSVKPYSGREGYGSISTNSAEEAVAKLWLALNKKT